MRGNTSYGAVLKNRGFLNLWVNQILVQFTYNSLNFALILWVYYLTHSNTAVAVFLTAVYLPSLLFGAISGILVDISDRKKLILVIDFLLAVLTLTLILFKPYFMLIILAAFVINSLAQLYTSAESSALPLIVKKKQLFAANSLFSTTFFSMFLLGFGLSGPIIGGLGINFIFIFGSLSLFAAFLLAFKFPSIATKENEISKKMKKALINKKTLEVFNIGLDQIKGTVKLIKGKLPILSSLFILAGMQSVVGVLAVLLPSFLEKNLQISATDVSYIVILPLGVGMIIGALLIGKLGYKIPRRILVGRSVLVAGLMLLLVGITPLILPAIQHFSKPKAVSFLRQPSLSAVVSFGSLLLGLIVVSIIIPSQTVLQENTPRGDRGKVFGVLIAVMSALSLPFILFTGVLSDIFGTIPIFLSIGGLVGFIGLLIIKPNFFFGEKQLPLRVREFLGLGHWKK